MFYPLVIGSRWEVGVLERRRARRFAVGWPVTLQGSDKAGQSFKETGKLENLSSAGALINLARSLQIGTSLDVLIKIPLKKDSWMNYSAEVVRVESNRLQPAVAIRFSTFRPKFVSE